jgi:adenosylmethionine-8-amino-7-oxononanoate aminotransferase
MVALAPPLTIAAGEMDEMLDILEASIEDVLGTAVPARTLVAGRASA